MSFENLNIKFNYNTEDDNLLEDFYLPVLKHASSYDRAVGFFSANILNQVTDGLKNLVLSGGVMRLVIGNPLSQDEFEAANNAKLLEEKRDELFEQLDDYLYKSENNKHGLKILSWLIATKRLTIKFAFRRNGMYHQKIGIVKDLKGNTIVFNGSANATTYALSEGYNSEEISVYPSCDTSFETHGKAYIRSFENLWNNRTANTKVIEISSSQYKLLAEKSKKDPSSTDYSELIAKIESLNSFEFPQIPTEYRGNGFDLFPHQKKALRLWKENNCQGILKLATGAGKTITSIFGVVSLFQERFLNNKSTCLIVSVPYIELADQWVKELGIFNIYPYECYRNKDNWEAKFKSAVRLFSLNEDNSKDFPFICAVVVNRTLCSKSFQNCIQKINGSNIIIIGDECHHHSSDAIKNSLPDAKFRIGLSATPFADEDEEFETPFPNEAKRRILDYYKKIVFTYSLADAIENKILTPYNYQIIPCYLTEEEQDQYDFISKSITKLFLQSKSRQPKPEDHLRFMQLCGKRTRLLGSASDKLEKLKIFASKIDINDRKHTLFYAGEGKRENYTDQKQENENIDLVYKCLFDCGWETTKFTSEVKSKDRKSIMEEFKKGTIEGLLAMKVLDEGIDIPICDKAFLLASTRNPRQYIQRRGRILRKAKNKKLAYIYDFMILPNENSSSKHCEQLKKAELERVKDFLSLCNNGHEVKTCLENLGVCYE